MRTLYLLIPLLLGAECGRTEPDVQDPMTLPRKVTTAVLASTGCLVGTPTVQPVTAPSFLNLCLTTGDYCIVGDGIVVRESLDEPFRTEALIAAALELCLGAPVPIPGDTYDRTWAIYETIASTMPACPVPDMCDGVPTAMQVCAECHAEAESIDAFRMTPEGSCLSTNTWGREAFFVLFTQAMSDEIPAHATPRAWAEQCFCFDGAGTPQCRTLDDRFESDGCD